MNVAEFVETTLREIVSGVIAAQEAAAGTGGEVNPLRRGDQTPLVRGAEIRDVEFDIAVIASSDSSSGGKLKVGIGSVGAALEGGSGKRQESENRIRFRVPIRLPSHWDTTGEGGESGVYGGQQSRGGAG